MFTHDRLPCFALSLKTVLTILLRLDPYIPVRDTVRWINVFSCGSILLYVLFETFSLFMIKLI